MKKGFKMLYCFSIFIICIIPVCLMPFFKNNAQIEKRKLAEFPAYIESGKLNIDFSTQFESWLNDRLPFRAYILSASNLIKGEFFHAPTSNVIVGKEGWLYFTEEGDDFMDTTAMTDDEIRSAAITLRIIQNVVNDKGGAFTFVPIPNKASVYGEYMPTEYIEAPDNNLKRLMRAADEYDVNYVDMLSVLKAKKTDADPVYLRRDSHWNNRGALIGYNAIMDSLGKEHKTYSDANYTVGKTWEGDLDKLLYPSGCGKDDQYKYDIKISNYSFTEPAPMGSTENMLSIFMSDLEQNDMKIISHNDDINDGSSLYMVRDSFGRAVLPYFIDNYENAEFRRTDVPDVANLADDTDVCYEIVERNLKRIISKTPYMYAPIADGLDPSAFKDGGSITVNIKEEGFGTKICGIIPDGIVSEDGRVYVLVKNGKNEGIYEAFPIYEKSVFGEQENKRGFSMMLEKSEDSANYEISVIYGEYIFNP